MSSDSSHSINQFSQVEVQQLYAAFKSIDSARDGAFTAEQLVHARPELQDNPLCQRILSVFDADRDGAVTFLELASSLARVAGDEETKLRFMFDMYDMDCDGFVSNGDLFKVVALMSGENLGASGASCASYFPNISASKRDITYKGLSMKSRSVKPVRKCDLITPGPGSYKTAPLHSRSVSIRARQFDSRLFTESTSRPGPGSYTLKPDGARAAFSMTGRPVDTTKGNPKVGPGQYDSKGDFDRYCLLPVNWEPPFVKSIRVL